jgi:hypothetical protein
MLCKEFCPDLVVGGALEDRAAGGQLEKYGIYHIDPRPGNVRFGE